MRYSSISIILAALALAHVSTAASIQNRQVSPGSLEETGNKAGKTVEKADFDPWNDWPYATSPSGSRMSRRSKANGEPNEGDEVEGQKDQEDAAKEKLSTGSAGGPDSAAADEPAARAGGPNSSANAGGHNSAANAGGPNSATADESAARAGGHNSAANAGGSNSAANTDGPNSAANAGGPNSAANAGGPNSAAGGGSDSAAASAETKQNGKPDSAPGLVSKIMAVVGNGESGGATSALDSVPAVAGKADTASGLTDGLPDASTNGLPGVPDVKKVTELVDPARLGSI